MSDGRPEAPATDGPLQELANEFAVVHVQRVHTHNGVRLEITSPRLGRSIRLDPVELESLTWQTPATFTAFMETPFGPEGDDDVASAQEEGR
ncbi:dihydrodiol dehydrogenase [Euzebya sp.]|uniref:dihydrodiol dehydrogenase n=1 Tax=Euzebya sp. TaxID=1971409 RepID=UPI003514934B